VRVPKVLDVVAALVTFKYPDKRYAPEAAPDARRVAAEIVAD
jgi:hypothetical protein